MGLHSSTKMLEYIVTWLRKQERRIISLDEALDTLANPSDEPFAVLIFDDGFRTT